VLRDKRLKAGPDGWPDEFWMEVVVCLGGGWERRGGGNTIWVCERQREEERGRGKIERRERGRQTDRQTDGQKDRRTDRQMDR